MNNAMREAKTAIKCDVYVLGWASVSLIATFGLCVLIGVKALGIAAVIGLATVWKLNWSKRRLSARFWWYCWGALLVLDLGLVLIETKPWIFSLRH